MKKVSEKAGLDHQSSTILVIRLYISPSVRQSQASAHQDKYFILEKNEQPAVVETR